MTTNAMYADLLAAQQEMPALQKSAINPHFGNRFVPLDELIPAVLPILNAHNLVLMQQPTVQDGKPALRTVLLHTSGEVLESTMLLQATKDDPQQQGSAITYARRYSLLAWLGLVADVDDDAETHRTQAPRGGSERHVPTYSEKPPATPDVPVYVQGRPLPKCPQGHGPMKFWDAGTSKAGKPVGARYKCMNRDCKDAKGYPETVWAGDWENHLASKAAEPSDVDPDEIPFE